MTNSPNNADRVLDLAESIFDDGASPEMLAELDDLLLTDGDSRDRYLDYCRLQVALRLELRAERAASRTHRRIEIESACPAVIPSSAPADGVFRNALNVTVGFFSHEMALSLLVATVVMSSALLLAWRFNITHYQHVAGTGSPANIAGPAFDAQYVGRITGMKDCRWNDPNTAPLAGAAVSLGREYSLESGLLEITYESGARVILEGPCKYKVDSAAGGYLGRGKLTARVKKNDELGIRNKELTGRESDIHHSSFITHHLFSVTTPTAVVTDLGTEFGVEVRDGGETEVHVFQGRVDAKWGEDAGEQVLLNTGQAASFNSRRSAIERLDSRPNDFPDFISAPRIPTPVEVAHNKTIIKWSGVYRYGDPTKHTSDWSVLERFGVWHVNDGVTDESKDGNSYWIGRDQTPDEYFIIYLAGRFEVERIELMNTHNSHFNNSGTKDFEIWAADEVEGENELVAPRLVLKGVLPCRFGAGGKIPYDIFSADKGDFTRFHARYVKFVAKTFYVGADTGCSGLNEIRVFATPAANSNKQPVEGLPRKGGSSK